MYYEFLKLTTINLMLLKYFKIAIATELCKEEYFKYKNF